MAQYWLKTIFGDVNVFCHLFQITIEKLDFLVKMPLEKEVLWIYSFGQGWQISILSFLDTLARAHQLKIMVWAIYFVFWLLRGTVPSIRPLCNSYLWHALHFIKCTDNFDHLLQLNSTSAIFVVHFEGPSAKKDRENEK